MTRLIGLTGATGALGSRVAERVSAAAVAADARVRLLVRDAARAPDLPGAEVTGFAGGYADGAGFAAALEGVSTLYLVSAAEAEDRVRQHRAAVAAAAGVERIVYTSFLRRNRGTMTASPPRRRGCMGRCWPPAPPTIPTYTQTAR